MSKRRTTQAMAAAVKEETTPAPAAVGPFFVSAEMAIENVSAVPLTYLITMSPGCRIEVMEGNFTVTLPGEAH